MTLPESQEGRLLRHGWRLIVSQAQADQLLRREIKLMAKRQQSGKGFPRDHRDLLAIKPGNWFRFFQSAFVPGRRINVWRKPQR